MYLPFLWSGSSILETPSLKRFRFYLETICETWCASCTIFVTVLLLTGPASKWSWWGMTTHFCERFVWYANIKNHGKITLRTSRNWFLSIFSLTQGESKNWRSSRRSRTSATKKIWQNVRRLKITSWVGAQGSTSITGNVRVELIEASLPKIRESLLEGSKESLLKAIVWTKYCVLVVQPEPLELLKSVSPQDQRVSSCHSRADTC